MTSGMRNRILVAAAFLVAAAAVFAFSRIVPVGRIGTGYAAERTCACVFVSGRALDSCLHDLDPLARKLVRVDVRDGEVRTRAALIITARARFDAATGCTLVE